MRQRSLRLLALGLSVSMALAAQEPFDHPDWSPDMKNVVALAYKGDPTALYLLASIFFDGTDAVIQDKRTASKLFLIAAKAGSSDAEFRLASMYFAGDGVRKSDDDGIYFLQRAADHGVALAQFGVGMMYVDGVNKSTESSTSIPQDSVKAYMWFNLCADAEEKCATARRNLALKMSARQMQDAIDAATDWKSKHNANPKNDW